MPTVIAVDDGVTDGIDNCPNTFNPHQVDSDGDGIGDACEEYPNFGELATGLEGKVEVRYIWGKTTDQIVFDDTTWELWINYTTRNLSDEWIGCHYTDVIAKDGDYENPMGGFGNMSKDGECLYGVCLCGIPPGERVDLQGAFGCGGNTEVCMETYDRIFTIELVTDVKFHQP